MNSLEFTRLVSNAALETIKDASDYIAEQHTKELETLNDGTGKIAFEDAINRIITSNLRTAVELSTVNTIKVLHSLGVAIPDFPPKDE